MLKAEAAVYGGYVIAREGGVIFIKGAIPGEVVEVSIEEKKRDYSVARVTEVVEPSDARVEPRCEYFGRCGGCQLQHMTYERQIALKAEVLNDCLGRIGCIERELEPTLSGPEFGYRLRAQWKVSKDGRMGFYREGTREVVPIDVCPLLSDSVNDATRRIRSIDMHGVKELHITCGDTAEVLIKGRGFDEALAEQVIAAGFSCVAFEDGSYRGGGFISLDLSGLSYSVSPWSFFQSNWTMNREVVRVLLEGLGPMEGRRVVDLYAGAGNFSIPVAVAGATVVAVEENPHSIRDGHRNVSSNNVARFQFVESTAEKARLKGKFDVILLDPPRAGLTNDAIARVGEMASPRIAYISCNPATFARDLKKLSGAYNIDSIRVVDFFPNTYHIESIAFLTRKNEEAPSEG